MSLSLTEPTLSGKNKVDDANPFLTLLKVWNKSGDVIGTFVHNTENVTYDSEVYQKFAFTLDAEKEAGDGALPTRNLSIANDYDAITLFLNSNSGLVGGRVKIIDVYYASGTAHLVKQIEYSINSTQLNSKWVTFGLGVSDPLRRRFPQYKALASNCPWTFGGYECKFTPGVGETCKRTLTDCTDKGNAANFGGRPGIRTMQRLV